MEKITLIIPGRPVPMVRMTRRGKYVKPRAQQYLDYLNAIAGYCYTVRPRPLLWDNISVDAAVYLPEGRRGDLDNYLKAFLDGLQRGGVFTDDKIVTEARVKIIPCPRGREKAEITIRKIG
ncbi:RusA family crossover junction endodeoxyribonuclease [Thermincola ferriacetica]|uniref:RusA family crossover junction endodeoxyribonuclease n=1 Tax=Thermincola ferriacetica TaxID=281456 RepID=UPI00068B26DD|nr:RusA family crossover junction endodeoxyribonuclease [Thermincola ferriacetica]